ncbi:hypothetical protein GCM10023223_25450 [Stackebrandtia albiflava]
MDAISIRKRSVPVHRSGALTADRPAGSTRCRFCGRPWRCGTVPPPGETSRARAGSADPTAPPVRTAPSEADRTAEDVPDETATRYRHRTSDPERGPR